MTRVIATQLLLTLRRQRTFLALLVTLLVMTALAGLIGWISHRTIFKVYDQAVLLLAKTGSPAPPNPFDTRPTLALLSNMVIYIPLIGALMALVLGHLSLADDESSGIGRMIFSRRVSRRNYVAGKMLGATTALAAIMAASLVVSVVSLLIVNGAILSAADLGRLVLFYLLSLTYLMAFALVGMVSVLLTRRRSMALLLALGVWLVLTFAIPQFTSGLRPTASLNPITDPVSTSQTFFDVTARARPLSVSEQYKEASTRILEIGTAESVSATTLRILPTGGLVLVLAALTVLLVDRHDYSRSSAHE